MGHATRLRIGAAWSLWHVAGKTEQLKSRSGGRCRRRGRLPITGSNHDKGRSGADRHYELSWAGNGSYCQAIRGVERPKMIQAWPSRNLRPATGALELWRRTAGARLRKGTLTGGASWMTSAANCRPSVSTAMFFAALCVFDFVADRLPRIAGPASAIDRC
jgi:hypothetical protein